MNISTAIQIQIIYLKKLGQSTKVKKKQVNWQYIMSMDRDTKCFFPHNGIFFNMKNSVFFSFSV